MLWKSCNIIHLVIKTDCLKASECIQGIFQITCVVVRAGICSLFCLQLFIYNMYITSNIRKFFALSYPWIFIDYLEKHCHRNDQIQPWILFRYIDQIFIISMASERKRDEFLR